MKKYGWQKISLILLLLLVALNSGITETKASEEHVPEGVTMQADFKPGYGETLGIFKKTLGQVVLIHATDTLGYWAVNELPLYMKDKIVTPEEGLALLQFLDESTISVAEDSELIINRFIFDPSKFDRSTFLNLKSGKSRFWVKKLKDYTRSEFKVKTKTMVAGVRGSDFVVEVGNGFTNVTALDDTVLELVSLKAPDKVIVLRSFEKARVESGQEVSPIEEVTPAEAAKIKNEMPMPFERDALDAAGIFETEGKVDPDDEETQEQVIEEVEGQTTEEAAVKKETVPTEVEESDTDVAVKEETVATETGTVQELVETPILDVGGGLVLIPEDTLEDPEPYLALSEAPAEPEIQWFEETLTFNPGDEPSVSDTTQTGTSILQAPPPPPPVIGELPGLPGLPGGP
jgi:hypothetical protein